MADSEVILQVMVRQIKTCVSLIVLEAPTWYISGTSLTKSMPLNIKIRKALPTTLLGLSHNHIFTGKKG